MKVICSLSAAAALLATILLASLPDFAFGQPWQTYRSDEFGFQVEMPGTPVVETNVFGTDATVDGGRLSFGVLYGNYHRFPPLPSEVEAYLDWVRPDLVKALGVPDDAVSEKRIALNGFPGREIAVNRGNFHAIHRVIIIGVQKIELLVIGNETLQTDPVAQHFLASFTLLRSAP